MSDSPTAISSATTIGPVKVDALPWESWGEGEIYQKSATLQYWDGEN